MPRPSFLHFNSVSGIFQLKEDQLESPPEGTTVNVGVLCRVLGP